MPLLDELLAEQTGPGPLCSVRLFLDQLPPSVAREEAEEVIANPAVQFRTLQVWAKRVGGRVGAEAFSRHRRGICACARTR